ncbi:phage tail tape measure protein [Cohnella terricola]|uniref:Phage tail tape measure protein n=1 Tax=Cohnella terricola TaxID=1289167 RepID=A0A559JDM0_9BACL|nr:phage tail tape measure protein [Cohnella terricola]TVX97968.1 phage tail tape measure protein [Cohnella terricola]
MIQDKNLNIKIKTDLNIGESLKNANRALKELETSSSLKKLSVRIGFASQDISTMMTQMNKLNATFRESIRVAKLVKEANASGLTVSSTLPTNQSKLQSEGVLKSSPQASDAVTRVSEKASFLSDLSPSLAKMGTVFKNGIPYMLELNKALRDIASVYQISDERASKYGEKIHNLSNDMGLATEEIMQLALHLGSLGVGESELMERLSTSAQFAKNANLDYSASANILESVVNAMGVTSARASDVLTYLGDSAKSSASRIGEAMRSISGEVGDAGLEFEKVASWIATLSSETELSSTAIGSSVNAMIERFQALTSTGFDEMRNTSLVQVSEALREANVDLVDSEGKFRNFGTIMDELGSRWASLSDSVREYVSATLAGESRSGMFESLMQNYSQSIQLFEGSLNANGSAQEKFASYLSGTEAKLNQLSNAWSGVWQSGFSSESFNGVIEVMIVLTKALDKFVQSAGVLPVIFGAIGFSSSALNVNFKNLVIGVMTLGKGLKALGVSARMAQGAIRGFLASTVVGALFVALGFVLEKLIGLFYKAKDSQNEYLSSLSETIKSTEDSITRITELNNQLKTFVGTQEELARLRSQMADEMPQIIDHYDAEGQAVYKTAQEINELIKKEKELNLQRKKELYSESSDQLKDSEKQISSGRKTIKKKQDEFDYSSAKYEALSFAERYANESNLANSDPFSKEYEDHINKLNAEIQRIFKEKGQYVSENFLSVETIGTGFLGAATKAKAELGQVESEINKARSKIDEGLNGYVSKFQDYNEILVEQSGQADRNVKVLLDNLGAAFVEAASETGDSAQEISYKYEQLAEQVNKHIQENQIDITKMIESGDRQGIIQIIQDISGDAKIAEETIAKFSNRLINTPKPSKDAGFALYSAELGEFDKRMNQSLSSFSKLSSAYQTLQNGENLSLDTILDLIDQYPKFAEYLNENNGLITDKGALLEEIANFEREERLEEAQRLLDSNKDTLDSLENKRRMYEQFYTAMAGALPLEIGKSMFSDSDREQYQAMIKDREKLEARVKALSKPIVFTKSTSRSGNSASTAKYEPNLKLSKAQLEIDKYNRALEDNSKTIDEAKAKGESYDQLLRTRLKLYSQLASEIGNLKSEQQQEQNKLKEILSKTGLIEKNGEVIANVEARLVALSKAGNSARFGHAADKLEEFVKRYLELTNQLADTNSQLKQVTMDIAATLQSGLDRIAENANKKKTHYNNAISLLGEINTEEEKKQLAENTDGIVKALAIQREDILKEFAKTKNKIRNSKSDQEKDAYTIYLETLKADLSNLNVESVQQAEASGKAHAEAIVFGFDKQLDDLNYSKSLLGNIDTEDEKRQAAKISENVRNVLLNGIDEYNRQIEELEGELSKKLTKEKRHEYQSKLEVLQGYVKDYKLKLVQLADEELSLRKSQADEIIGNYKKMLEQKRDLELNAIDRLMEAEDERHNKRLKDIDEESNAFKKDIDTRLKAMDRLNASEDYQREIQKLSDERSTIQNKYNTLLKDNSFEAKKKRAELEQQLNAIEEQIADKQRERARTSSKEALEDLLSDREEFYEEQRNQEDSNYNKTKSQLENEKKLRETHWKAVLEDEKSFYQLKQKLISDDASTVTGALSGLRGEYERFFSYLQSQASHLGETFGSINSNFQMDFDQLKNSPLSNSGGNSGNSGSGNTQDTARAAAWNQYLENKKKAEALLEEVKKGKLTDKDRAEKNAEIEKLQAINAKYRDEPYRFPEGNYAKLVDYKYYHLGGEVGKEGTTVQKWWKKILKSDEVPSILRKGEVVLDQPIRFIQDMASRMMGGLSNVMTARPIISSATPSGTTIENLNMTFTGSLPKDGRSFADEFVDGLSRKGIRIGQ